MGQGSVTLWAGSPSPSAGWLYRRSLPISLSSSRSVLSPVSAAQAGLVGWVSSVRLVMDIWSLGLIVRASNSWISVAKAFRFSAGSRKKVVVSCKAAGTDRETKPCGLLKACQVNSWYWQWYHGADLGVYWWLTYPLRCTSFLTTNQPRANKTSNATRLKSHRFPSLFIALSLF